MMGDFSIDLQASKDRADCYGTVSGSETHVITDPSELDTFGLHQFNRINDAIMRGGNFARYPDGYWAYSPCRGMKGGSTLYRGPWAGQEVKTTLRPVSAVCTGVTTTPVGINSITCDNTSGADPLHCGGGLSKTVSRSVSSGTTETRGISTSAKVGIKVGIEGVGDVTGEDTNTFSHGWGESKTDTYSVTVGTTASADVMIPPGHISTVYLSSDSGAATFDVTYQATLSGSIVWQYWDWANGHRDWIWDVNAVLQEAGLPTSISITENVTVDFYTHTCIKQKDGPFDPHYVPICGGVGGFQLAPYRELEG